MTPISMTQAALIRFRIVSFFTLEHLRFIRKRISFTNVILRQRLCRTEQPSPPDSVRIRHALACQVPHPRTRWTRVPCDNEFEQTIAERSDHRMAGRDRSYGRRCREESLEHEL